MGVAINSDKRDFCPMVTPDGKYLFFTGTGNEKGSDIYWLDSQIINNLKPDN